MKIVACKESFPGETRTAITPFTAAHFVQRGLDVEVESGLGIASGHVDSEYTAAGARVVPNGDSLAATADIHLVVRPPNFERATLLKHGSTLIGFLDPANQRELLDLLADREINALSLELLPRATRAQKMDALSSQANIAGYMSVVLAAGHSNRMFPMLMTAAGTVAAARVLVLGAGVAGLQAMATARRLGARVSAYDPRPETEDEIRSVGASFLRIRRGDTHQSKDGSIIGLDAAELAAQRHALQHAVAESDVIITAAQVVGGRAPLLVSDEMIRLMKPGAVVVDLAVESGGNLEDEKPGTIEERHGVKIVALRNLAMNAPFHASQLYSRNLANFVDEFWDASNGCLGLDKNDELIKACLVTNGRRQGELTAVAGVTKMVEMV